MVNSDNLTAQSDAAPSLNGSVFDSGGAAIPGALVTVSFLKTGVKRVTTTDESGRYLFFELTVGAYRVVAQSGGFAAAAEEFAYRGVPIQASFHLSAAAAESTIEVTADGIDPIAPARVKVTLEEIDRIPSESVSAPLSSLITMTTPGVAADSNGSFHPLGDHAEASFVIDGQPITDQQSRTFSTQIALNALQSLEVREGAPQADAGDKTSMVIVATTRSGLDQRRPSGTVEFARSAFDTTQVSGNLGFGRGRFGSFMAVDGMKSGRFLDTPELKALHAQGNARQWMERLDWKATRATSLQMNASASSSWFETPNTYDQEALRQDQRQTIGSFNLAPSALHTFSGAAFGQLNLWLRQDKVRYSPSADPLADTPATLAQGRRLTNIGLRPELRLARGRHTASVGAEWKHTFLAEQFTTGLTAAGYNSPCLNADGSPSPNTALRAANQCVAVGLAVNPAFLPGLVPIDLTRGGHLYDFHGATDVKQKALFGQDSVRLGNWSLNLGLRFDVYNGITRGTGLQPRTGVAYSAAPIRTVFRGAYSRVFITPYNENLIVASSAGPGSSAASLGAAAASALRPGHRNQFNVGMETELSKALSVSAEYFWKFTYGAYDFDVLLNSPLTFPTQFRKSKIDGGLVRITLATQHGFAGYATVSHVRSRLFGPETGGVTFSAPYANVARPDHDQGLAMNLYLRYQVGKRGPWAGVSYRYDGGLVAVAVPTFAAALRLTADEQQQMGLHCGADFATATNALRGCAGELGATRIRIPPTGTEDDDRNPPRVAVRNGVDLAIGQDALVRHERQTVGVRVSVVNLTNFEGLYNFLSTFSGTHFVTSRSVTAQLRYAF